MTAGVLARINVREPPARTLPGTKHLADRRSADLNAAGTAALIGQRSVTSQSIAHGS